MSNQKLKFKITDTKALSNFWRTLKGAGTFVITDTKLYVPVDTLSTQDNAKLLKQLESGFKRTIKWNKYQSRITTQTQKRYLDI